MLTAIINNAEKFSPETAEITIKLQAQGKQLNISIIDHGEGIEKRDLPYIFEEFYKGSNHQKEGMGVGLLLAKHIIGYHKGTISVKTKVKKGTTIEVRLPKITI
jgi:signal transduction histidine kinase